jgi:hypothetical protein
MRVVLPSAAGSNGIKHTPVRIVLEDSSKNKQVSEEISVPYNENMRYNSSQLL